MSKSTTKPPTEVVIDLTAEPEDGPVPKRAKTGSDRTGPEDAVCEALASARDLSASRSAIKAVRAKLASVPRHLGLILEDANCFESAEDDGFWRFDIPAKSTSFWRVMDLDFFVHTKGTDIFICSRADGQRDILLSANNEDGWHHKTFEVAQEVGTQGLEALAKGGSLDGVGKVSVHVRPAAAKGGVTLEVLATDEEAFSELYTLACGVVRALCDTDAGEMPTCAAVSVSFAS